MLDHHMGFVTQHDMAVYLRQQHMLFIGIHVETAALALASGPHTAGVLSAPQQSLSYFFHPCLQYQRTLHTLLPQHTSTASQWLATALPSPSQMLPHRSALSQGILAGRQWCNKVLCKACQKIRDLHQIDS